VQDVALSLIHRIPKLPLTHESDGQRPLYALAHMPCAFPSGSGFGRLQQLLYDSKFSDFILFFFIELLLINIFIFA